MGGDRRKCSRAARIEALIDSGLRSVIAALQESGERSVQMRRFAVSQSALRIHLSGQLGCGFRIGIQAVRPSVTIISQ